MKNIRIETIANMVKKGMVVADIGTDHALLPVLLVKQKKSNRVYACDIGQGPLEAAKLTIQKEGMNTSIFPILSNGFEHVPMDTNGAVIAGMGYMTAVEILEKAIDRLANMQQILVEVNRDTDLMRQWISDHHYTIDQEEYVFDRNHDYMILSFTTKEHEPYSFEDIVLGPYLKQGNQKEYRNYCEKQFKKIEEILAKSGKQAYHYEDLCKKQQLYMSYLGK